LKKKKKGKAPYFYTWFKKVAKSRGRRLNFISCSSLNLAKISMDHQQFGCITKLTNKKTLILTEVENELSLEAHKI
jgi:hypothetical protein